MRNAAVIWGVFLGVVILLLVRGEAYADGALVVTPRALEFVAWVDGENPAGQVLRISNSAAEAMDWTIEEDCPWLSLSRTSGRAESGYTSLVTVSVDAAGLAPGEYACEMLVRGTPGTGSPAVVPVTLRPKPLKYSGGSGTAGDPYLIGDVADWLALVASPGDYGAHFLLTADLDLAGVALTPVASDTSTSPGFQGTRFTGVLDGGGHVIRNAVINLPGTDDVGLFGCLSDSAQIRNVGIENAVITGRDFVGGLIGSMGKISSCYVKGIVSGRHRIGGLCGYGGDVDGCYTMGTVSGNSRVGGVSGEGWIAHCYSTCSVTGDSQVGALVGGYGGADSDSHFLAGAGPDNGKGSPLSAEEMRLRESYRYWHFVGDARDPYPGGTWKMIDGLTMPVLAWEERFVYAAALENGESPASQVMRFHNSSAQGLLWYIDPQNLPDWLTVSQLAGNIGAHGQAEVMLHFASAGLTGAEYVHLMEIRDSSTLEVIDSLLVGLRVTGPKLSVGSGLYFYAWEGGDDPSPQSLSIFNPGGGSLAWAIATEDACPWLAFEPMSGVLLAGEQTFVSVRARTQGVSGGTHTCRLIVTGEGAEDGLQGVAITFDVKGPRLLAPSSCDFTSWIGEADPTAKTVTIENGGGGLLEWAVDANSLCDWVEVYPRAGALTSLATEQIVITVRTAGFTRGLHTCDIQLTAPYATSSPRIIRVNLLVRSSEPWLVPDKVPTIQQAINLAQDGDVIIVAPGRYYENIVAQSRDIVLRSENPDDWEVVMRTVIDGGKNGETVRFTGQEGPDFELSGFTVIGGGGLECNGIIGHGTHATIRKCYVRGRGDEAGIYWADGLIDNCIIARNGGGLAACRGVIRNCTIVGNRLGLFMCKAVIENCIIWDNVNGPLYDSLTPRYSCYPGRNANGNIAFDPLFSEDGFWDPNELADDPSDDVFVRSYHLKSEAGRWDSVAGAWVYDDVTSPCIDAGDPNSEWRGEFWPHGGRINMGAYGGTGESSMSLNGAGNAADLDYDEIVGLGDFGVMAREWGFGAAGVGGEEPPHFGEEEPPHFRAGAKPWIGDLNRDGLVDIGDLAVLGENWAWTGGE